MQTEKTIKTEPYATYLDYVDLLDVPSDFWPYIIKFLLIENVCPGDSQYHFKIGDYFNITIRLQSKGKGVWIQYQTFHT